MDKHDWGRKKKGYYAEQYVAERYRRQGRRICTRNFTIRGGEIDIVVESGVARVFVEVKDVSSRDDVIDFIPPHKLQALQRTIEQYMHRYPTTKQPRLDVVFFCHDAIMAQYTDVTFYE